MLGSTRLIRVTSAPNEIASNNAKAYAKNNRNAVPVSCGLRSNAVVTVRTKGFVQCAGVASCVHKYFQVKHRVISLHVVIILRLESFVLFIFHNCGSYLSRYFEANNVPRKCGVVVANAVGHGHCLPFI